MFPFVNFCLNENFFRQERHFPGNKYDGHWGYSCMRITPEQAYKNIDKFRGCTNGFEGPKAMFAKWCFDRNETAFTEAVDEIFR